MAEDGRHEGGDLAAQMAVAGGSEEARDYLRRQSRLTDLQIADLEREDHLRHWSLRVHHISDVMKLAFEFAMAFIVIALVGLICAAIWTAAHDDGLVIEAFKVPPEMAQKGLTGDVVASALLDRLKELQANTDSARAPSTYASNFGNDIKVEIPNTGISISEAYRYLAGWLGNETHISGEVYRTDKGIALTVRTSDSAGARFDGRENDFDALMRRAAEHVYGQTQPFRYGVYLLSHGRVTETDAVLRQLATNGPATERPWAYALWIYPALNANDLDTALSRGEHAAALGPDLMLAQINAASVEEMAGHDESELRYLQVVRHAFEGNGRRQVVASDAVVMDDEAAAAIGEETGDFAAALSQYDAIETHADFGGSHWSSAYMKSADAALRHDVEASRRYLGRYTDAQLPDLAAAGEGWNLVGFDFPQYEQDVARGDWKAARADLAPILATPFGHVINDFAQSWSELALASANSGDMIAARAEIAKTPRDCIICLRARARIDVAQKNWNGAAYWFARAAALAPSIPFAYAEWGQMLLANGDDDGAIAKFKTANAKGPHFADPLEMWGEALIATNRSDLALAKFEEADKYAPNWGRLHLKWGEALYWSGDKSGATKQFAIAASLDLTPSEKSELARVHHG